MCKSSEQLMEHSAGAVLGEHQIVLLKFKKFLKFKNSYLKPQLAPQKLARILHWQTLFETIFSLE